VPWFRVDDGFHSHPKVLDTSLAARGLWVTAGSWSSAHLTDGVVPDRALALLGGSPELAAELVTAGLWRRTKGGYKFHDWLDKNPSKQAVDNQRKTNADRQKRWRNAQRNGGRNAVTNGVSNGVSNGAPTRPITNTGLYQGDRPARTREPGPQSQASRHPSSQTVTEALRRPD
jgi:hypothetical protein